MFDHRQLLISSLGLALLAPVGATAQSSANSAKECLTAVDAAFDAGLERYSATAKSSGNAAAELVIVEVDSSRAREARACLARFGLRKAGVDDIAPLVVLAGYAYDIALIAQLVDKLAAVNADPALRLTVLEKAFEATVPGAPSIPKPGALPHGVRYAAMLDSLGAPAALARVDAHGRLVYLSEEGSTAQQRHGDAAIAAARSIARDIKERERAVEYAFGA